jgi:molybdenum cofactor guanylyltransferase
MGGQDKGLIDWQGHPLAWHVASTLALQVSQVTLNANRHLDTYRHWPWPVCPDNPDLPAHGGPMMGLLTGLMQTTTDWLQLAPCDAPLLPADLVKQLQTAATSSRSRVAVPVSRHLGGSMLYHHWTAALVSRSCMSDLSEAVQAGERRMGHWMTRQRWTAVLFDDVSLPDAFMNMNTPEDLLTSTKPSSN